MKTTLRQKLVCPYCHGKQEYAGKDYFTPGARIVQEIQCDHCDERFNASLGKDQTVETYSNLVILPELQ